MTRRAAPRPSLLLATTLVGTALVGTALVGTALLAGCGGGDTATVPSASTGDAPAPSGSAAPGTPADGGTPDGGATAAPPFEGDTAPATREASADALVTVTAIRTGRQDGYDRVVLEVAGTGTPGWDVRYVEEAYAQGMGGAIEVAGDAVLQVTVTGAGYPFDTGVEEWAGPDPLPGEGTSTVTEVAWDATYEGTSVAVIGTTAEAPFRVYALEDPTRIVVEIAG
ncbi:hypothetical protein SAMN06893096_11412 [Geodermatophilus pulveris]|uniref:AMIN-like domain-containing protein n=1 Tax=Geodermatophilus pulveris TaxID=1564159 RepID=A0A239JCQ1_9ACTN|nr:hypothetical protein [Geodermatophilus pulveris]SNT03625.1 hypothetical protein SAMN06893096_11412 [Geodermatophilus pulveris]